LVIFTKAKLVNAALEKTLWIFECFVPFW